MFISYLKLKTNRRYHWVFNGHFVCILNQDMHAENAISFQLNLPHIVKDLLQQYIEHTFKETLQLNSGKTHEMTTFPFQSFLKFCCTIDCMNFTKMTIILS